jgi:hypothetical protein
MPFDAFDLPIEVIVQQRRERAAAFWKTIPAKKFNLDSWEECAIGWLAETNFEGWKWRRLYSGPERFPVGPDNRYAYWAAESFFGITYDDAERCFDPASYRSDNPRSSTVAKRLLRSSIHIHSVISL